MEKAILGGGCFWCLEAVFERLRGVLSVVSGYAGGAVINPSYEAICTGTTGHAEVVEISFDPAIISYHQLLEVFFAIHDPCSLNRQGADVGTQYRSVIFIHNGEQRMVAQALIDGLSHQNVFDRQIVTEVLDAPVFFPAEPYHQGYFRNNPGQGYCAYVVAPKLHHARQLFVSLLKSADQ
jgi:peptide-methionine (S)-S-oxide reductase